MWIKTASSKKKKERKTDLPRAKTSEAGVLRECVYCSSGAYLGVDLQNRPGGARLGMTLEPLFGSTALYRVVRVGGVVNH